MGTGLNPSPVLNVDATVGNKDVILGGEVGFDTAFASFTKYTAKFTDMSWEDILNKNEYYIEGKVRFSSQGWSWQPEDVADEVSELTPTRLLVVKVISRLDTLALCLLERMISFDPKHRPTAEEVKACGCHGINLNKALFVPNMSLVMKVVSSSFLLTTDSLVHIYWQLTLQGVWKNIILGERGMLQSFIELVVYTRLFRFAIHRSLK
ncbi:hypothetical protein Tco_1215929 [Tanacetum coccineum]